MTTDELLQRWSDGSITADELRELTAKLAEPEHQSALLDDWLLESSVPDRLPGASVAGLRESETNRSVERMDSVRAKSWPGWLSWRPLTAAAAGLAIGLFCASVVMAYIAAPSAGKTITLFSDSFEDGAPKFVHGFPDRPEVWGGDAGEVVSGSGEVQPFDGLHMARLDPSPTATLSYLDRIVDVQSLPVPQGNEVRQVTVTASFHAAERGLRDRYTLRVAAFADAPAHWVGREWKEIEGALAASKRSLSTMTDAEGWQTLTAMVEVPREARSLVISLASGVFQNPDRKTAHYVDGVQATLSIGSQPAKMKTKRLNITAK